MDGFDEFWQSYPRKVAKGDARKAWLKLKPGAELRQRIQAALGWQCQQFDWLKDDGSFVPYPATYLRGERWEDEMPKKKFRPHVVSTRDWRDECDALHDGRCTNVHFHEAKKSA